MDQGNMLLGGAVDSNELIREANIHNLQDYQGKLKQDKSSAEEGNIYHGGLAAASLGGLKSFGDQYKRGVKLGGVKNMISSDFRGLVPSFLKSKPASVSESVPFVRAKPATVSFGDSVGSKPGVGLSSGFRYRPAPVAEEADDEPLFKNSEPTIQPTPRAPPTSAKLISKPATSVAEAGEEAGEKAGEEKAGGIVAQGIERVGGGVVGSLGNTVVSKSLGNVGGAIDLVEDLHNIGKKGGFLGGQGNTTGDKIASASTLGATALDVASIALPFLAPVAAIASITAGVEGISNTVANNINTKAGTTKNYKANIETYKTPQSAAALGFLATTQTNPLKLIGGGGTF
jgi:hypothetical protein